MTVTEETQYPFEETIRFAIELADPTRFPLHVRIPGWCKKATIRINGHPHAEAAGPRMVKIDRTWRNGDRIELTLPMSIRLSRWVENSVAVERGPLVYALRIEEEWKWVENPDQWGDYWEVYPESLQNASANDELEGVVSKKGQVCRSAARSQPVAQGVHKATTPPGGQAVKVGGPGCLQLCCTGVGMW